MMLFLSVCVVGVDTPPGYLVGALNLGLSQVIRLSVRSCFLLLHDLHIDCRLWMS